VPAVVARVVKFTLSIGALHEVAEIITHSHAFETADVIVNAVGALIGAAIQRAVAR